ncbi:MAG: ATP synthase F1 subunit gamma [Oscillospiraceae bacterium]|nr:ATP synthase F1 subunit gamma [Oscillospiraceae bacterium]MBQ2384476.1 ATP synthase F1 subunit gamma [Oscillospiraceae bacterium]MBQ5711734.1 ATP synthase F1 subunit gamma [Oscillospiraceae bacterium]
MAGVSTKEIKTRIRSMESTRQITKAMEMVAASKLRQAQAKIACSRPYFETLYSTITKIVESGTELSSPYLYRESTGKVLYIVIAGDRGLAGGYNSNILKLVMSQIQDKEATVLPIGKKTLDHFRTKQVPLFTEAYPEAAAVDIGDCFSMAKLLSRAYRAGKYDEIHVAYTGFVSVLSQTPTTLRLLPLSDSPVPKGNGSSDIVYEPSAEEVFDTIVPEYLGGVLYGALCESRASEQAARRTAMDSATQNAEDMIADLSLKFNQARQAAITQEITEIVAGS